MKSRGFNFEGEYFLTILTVGPENFALQGILGYVNMVIDWTIQVIGSNTTPRFFSSFLAILIL